MSSGRRLPPQIVLRAAVVVGCLAMLVGVAGVFYFGTIGREVPPPPKPEDLASVIVRTPEPVAGLQVEVRWQEDGGSVRFESGRFTENGTWTFEQAAHGEPLTLAVYRHDDGKRALVHEQPALLRKGTTFEVVVRDLRPVADPVGK